MSTWTAWHRTYLDPSSGLSRRLRVIQDEIATWLDLTRDRPVSVLSVCAGDGRDLLDVLASRPDAGRVTATLVELDPTLAEGARARAAALHLDGVQVLCADAGDLETYASVPPADLVLLCGVLGNIDDADVERTIGAVRTWCADGARVIWTRARREPDLTPSIRTWFFDNGFRDMAYHAIPDSVAAVGVAEVAVPPDGVTRVPGPAILPGGRIFTFGSSSSNERTLAVYEAKADAYRADENDPPTWLIDFLDRVVARLPPAAAVLEIGSGTGRAARSLRDRGVRVQPSDATGAFLEMMRRDGLVPLRLDVLHDEVGGTWDAVLALAVFLHFTREELGAVLDRVRRGMRPVAVLAFTVKVGDGEGWSDHKLGMPRWFRYWRLEPLREFLEERGWRVESIEQRTGVTHEWLLVLASRVPPAASGSSEPANTRRGQAKIAR